MAILVLIGIVCVGGFIVYKRKFAHRDLSVSMHFQNPRTTFDAAKVNICKIPTLMHNSSRLNEIFINGKPDNSLYPVSANDNDITLTDFRKSSN